MINGALRPWGNVPWLLGMRSLQGKEWFVIGSVATQDRCTSIFKHAKHSFTLGRAALLEIEDGESSFSDQSRARRDVTRNDLEATISAAVREFHRFELFEPILRLKRCVEGWLTGRTGLNVILDVSSLPEQFYFPIVRWLSAAPEVENLVVTYMLAEQYTTQDLAYNARDCAQLPTFVSSQVPEPAIKNVIVGIGFLPFSLPEWLKTTYEDRDIRVSLIFPFPSDPANVARGWEFVRRIEANMTLRDDRQIARIDAHDMSACFDRLRLITKNGKSPSVFAPYGPKTHSVAMCLQAINMGAEAFYTHPDFYHPEYSTGVKLEGALPAGFAYALRLHGRSLYV